MKNKELEEYFGKLMRDRRKEKKITQEQLAELVGISTTYLRETEHGNHSITWKIWLKICMALQIDVNDLIEKVQLNNEYLLQ